MSKVAVTGPIPDEGLRLLREAGLEIALYSGEAPISREELLKLVSGAAGIIPTLTSRIDDAVMEAAGPSLKVIAACTVGTDHIDLEAARRRGIAVTNTPGVLTEAVVEHALSLLLALSCRVLEGDRMVREGRFKGWGMTLLLGADLHGKTLGLIGAGRIGSAFARACRSALGMKVLYLSRSRKPELEEECRATFVGLDDLLHESDVVAPFVCLNDQTRHLLNRECLGMMKPTAFVLNVSRGPVINEAALVEALRAGRIAGAALDVYENEPKLTPGLADLPNVILAPHTASAGRETRARMAALAAKNLIAALAGGEPPNRIA